MTIQELRATIAAFSNQTYASQILNLELRNELESELDEMFEAQINAG